MNVHRCAALAFGMLAACRPAAQQSAGAPAARNTPMTSDTSAPLVAFLGDSLTSGWHLEEQQAYPALIANELGTRGVAVRVLNAGVSGDTSAGGRRRLSWVMKQKPDIVVIALGANDGLRGLDLAPMETNLREILSDVRAAGGKGLLVGMKIPPSLGPDYARRFEQIYAALAKDFDVPLVPFLLEGVAGRAELTFPDGIHPTAEGHKRMASNVLPYLWELLKS
jgi:acyl-CoA thioesterase I